MGSQISRKRTSLRLEAVEGIQEIGATFLARVQTKTYQVLSLSMLALCISFALVTLTLSESTAMLWFPYFGTAMLTLVLVDIAIHIVVPSTMKEITKEVLEGE